MTNVGLIQLGISIFLKFWSLDDSSRQLIVDNWNTYMVGFLMFVLSTKLRSLKHILKKWNKETFDNIHFKESFKLLMKLIGYRV